MGHFREKAFHDVEDVFLRTEGHFQIQLVELARRSIGARIFIAETRRDLKVAVEPRDHQQLFELLGRLGEGVEHPGIQTAGDEKVSCALRRTVGQDGRLDLQKTPSVHVITNEPDDLVSVHNVPVYMLTAQVQEAPSEPKFFVDFLLVGNEEGNLLGGGFHRDGIHPNLHLTGREGRIDCLITSAHHHPSHSDYTLGPDILCNVEIRHIPIVVEDGLCDAVVVAQINENELAVVALTMDPARKLNDSVLLLDPKLPAGMRTEGVFRISLLLLCCTHDFRPSGCVSV